MFDTGYILRIDEKKCDARIQIQRKVIAKRKNNLERTILDILCIDEEKYDARIQIKKKVVAKRIRTKITTR